MRKQMILNKWLGISGFAKPPKDAIKKG